MLQPINQYSLIDFIAFSSRIFIDVKTLVPSTRHEYFYNSLALLHLTLALVSG